MTPAQTPGPIFAITLTCAQGHTQTISIQGMTRAQAEDYAYLLAGRSRFFLEPIPDDAVGSDVDQVGFCTCRSRILRPEIVEVA
jgi:hypothetical protein